ncbi:alpha/beta hydrolase [Flavihumibacter petaseus]|uniref:Putative hydrolase n=1 Tax=Flavihumibacter petaseus NBRC 106054 TaxID=1220578 RepID=A0A0E9N4T5_9BACT|nr:alpha/beta hydrolase [Flavihumibacter petaseus]GAO44691.1 putative hydrolase [Flavihumibacter petaseus NBRC 106054]
MSVTEQFVTDTFLSEDEGNVAYKRWTTAAPPVALVVFAHGFNSHSGYFQWAAEQLTAQGFEVFAIDFPGRGYSDGERYYISDYRQFALELGKLVSIAQDAHPGKATFLLGHSAGGVLSSIYVLDHQEKLAGFICESFAFQVPAPDFALAVLKGLSHVFPHAHVLKLKNEDFSRDPAVVSQMNNDTLIANEVQPTKTVQQLVLADERLKAEMASVTLPLLILHGTEDKATKPSGSQYFYDTASSPDKTLKLYQGHYHDLLNDLDREVVMKDIIDWLKKRV